jgi:hypothetical protein
VYTVAEEGAILAYLHILPAQLTLVYAGWGYKNPEIFKGCNLKWPEVKDVLALRYFSQNAS